MINFRANNINHTIYLIGITTLFLGWLLIPQDFIASDPWRYSSIAYRIMSDKGLDPSIFGQRLGVIIPVALCYKLFGVSIYSTNLWPLMSAMLTLTVLWLALPDIRQKTIAVLLTLSMGAIWQYSSSLYPDLIAGAFMALSVFMLTRRSNHNNIMAGLIGSASLFVAFLAKESAYWCLPLWLYAIYEDIINKSETKYFWIAAFVLSATLGVLYCLFCQIAWGDPLARFKVVQSLTGVHLWAWDKASTKELIKRLTIQPIELYTQTFSFPFFLSIIALYIQPAQLRYWSYYLILTIIFFWFGSTSFTSYEPMPVFDRMILPSLAPIIILSSWTTNWIIFQLNRFNFASAFAIVLFLFITTSKLLIFIYSSTVRPMESDAIVEIKKEIYANPRERIVIITSDQRSPESLKMYFGYNYPENLNVLDAITISDPAIIYNYSRILIYLNSERSSFLKSAYGQSNADSALRNAGFRAIYNKNPYLVLEPSMNPESVCNHSWPSGTGISAKFFNIQF